MDQFERDVWGAKAMLMGFAMKWVRHVDDAEDIVSQAMLNALSNRASFDGRNIHAWLMTITKNVALTKHRRDQRVVYTDDPRYADALVARDNPERAMVVADAWNELSNLSDEPRETVTLLGLGSDYETVSALTGVAVGTVKSRAHRAREALQASGALNG